MSGQWHGGKGSSPRRTSISHEEWSSRWDAIFQRDLKDETGNQETTTEGLGNTSSAKKDLTENNGSSTT